MKIGVQRNDFLGAARALWRAHHEQSASRLVEQFSHAGGDFFGREGDEVLRTFIGSACEGRDFAEVHRLAPREFLAEHAFINLPFRLKKTEGLGNGLVYVGSFLENLAIKSFKMQALEVIGTIDKDGFLKIEKPLAIKNRKVKVIILFPDDDVLDDSLWLRALANNPSLDFLNEPEENVYTSQHGKPFVADEI